MESIFHNQDSTRTAFVQLNSYACTACWKCIEACSNMVIDKSFLFVADTLIHEQVLLYDTNKCLGCMKCVEACKFDAITINE
jgi:2-oxoglutarate ferredoxin oxidoreductase subunit delta